MTCRLKMNCARELKAQMSFVAKEASSGREQNVNSRCRPTSS
jgi:hypothetical protein